MSDRSNVAIFSYAYRPHVGGAELAVEEITSRLSEMSFTCFTNRFNGTPETEKIGVVQVVRVGDGVPYQMSVAQKFKYMFLAWRAAEREHQKKNFSMVWALMASYGAGAALLFKLFHPRIPLLLTLQEGDSESHIRSRVGVWYPIWKILFVVAKRIQVISESLKEFAKAHGAEEGQISVIPNGVDLSKFTNTSKLKTKNEQEKVIITTSRLVPKNGVDILIRAFSILVSRKPSAISYKLIIVGDGPERENLKLITKNLQLEEQVEFLGHVSPEEIPAVLSRANVFVRLSRSEGLGSSFLEAMAAGLPVVGTRVGGIVDFIKDGETGLLAEKDNPEDAAEKIERLFSEKNIFEKLSRNGKALVSNTYSWDTVAETMRQEFKKLFEPHVVVATGIFPPAIGGPATYAKFLADHEKEIGINPIGIVTYGNRNTIRNTRVDVIENLSKGIKHIVYFWRVMRRNGFGGNGTVYAVDSSLGAAGVAKIGALITGASFVVRVTGDYAWEQGVQRFGISDDIDTFQRKRYGILFELFRSLVYGVVRSADRVIVPSDYLQKMAIGWGAEEGRVTVIPNPVSIPHGITKKEAREKLNISGKIIISAGRFVPWKGFEELIDSFPSIQERIPDSMLVLAGDGPERQALVKKIEEKGLRERILLPGALAKDELIEWLSAADLFVLNSSYEGLSHQLIEAVCGIGLPAVVTKKGGNPEVAKEFPERVTLIEEGHLVEEIVKEVNKNARMTHKKLESGKFAPEYVSAELKRFFVK